MAMFIVPSVLIISISKSVANSEAVIYEGFEDKKIITQSFFIVIISCYKMEKLYLIIRGQILLWKCNFEISALYMPYNYV